MIRLSTLAGLAIATGTAVGAQQPNRDSVSAPIRDVRYDVTFMRSNGMRRIVDVAMTFATTGSAPVVLSLPAWTPGAYEISNFVRWVDGVRGDGRGGQAARVGQARLRHVAHPSRRREVGARDASSTTRIRWTTRCRGRSPTFCCSTGPTSSCTPKGKSLDFAATVAVHTEADWNVATGMPNGAMSRTFTATNYHDLVDMPFFVGRFDLDSARVVESVGPAGDVSRRRDLGAGSADGVGPAQARDSAGERRVRRDAVGELHDHADRGFGVRRRERFGAPELARRRVRAVVRRQRVPAVALCARDLSFVEREAAAAVRHLAIQILSSAAHALALGLGGDHRLLRRPRRGARRRRSTRRGSTP